MTVAQISTIHTVTLRVYFSTVQFESYMRWISNRQQNEGAPHRTAQTTHPDQHPGTATVINKRLANPTHALEADLEIDGMPAVAVGAFVTTTHHFGDLRILKILQAKTTTLHDLAAVLIPPLNPQATSNSLPSHSSLSSSSHTHTPAA